MTDVQAAIHQHGAAFVSSFTHHGLGRGARVEHAADEAAVPRCR